MIVKNSFYMKYMVFFLSSIIGANLYSAFTTFDKFFFIGISSASIASIALGKLFELNHVPQRQPHFDGIARPLPTKEEFIRLDKSQKKDRQLMFLKNDFPKYCLGTGMLFLAYPLFLRKK